ncbi:hypothetical protein [Sorangium sp. So ce1151]|uniref:hypothetical protein n=1 Tax=Sorangium sp. So ce1151 TaxID=3133332 RepID=UPI003F60B15C
MAARSTNWTITNATASDLSLSSSKLDHGVWARNPPQVIKPGQTATFCAESDGMMTGDEGTLTYASPDGDFVFQFNNPFLGTDGYGVRCPDGYDHKTHQQTGNDQTLSTRCFKVT